MKSLIAVLVALCAVAHGQPPPDRQAIDSLKLRLLEKATDYERAMLLTSLAGYYVDVHADSSTVFVNEAIALCPSPDHDTTQVRIYIQYAKALQSKRKRDARYTYLLKAKDATKRMTPPSKYRRAVYSELGDYYYSLQHADSTIYYDLAVLDNSVDTLDVVIALK
ncbi:MAG: hypothetical protein ACOYW3_06880, partial [Bacteroidota bacterium]